MIYEGGFADGWADFALSNVDPDYVSLSLWLQRGGWGGEFWMGDMVELYWKYAGGMSRENGVPIGDYVGDMLDDLSSRIPPRRRRPLPGEGADNATDGLR